MSMEFGKLNFSVSFNPTSAFPLDARSYFESLSEAESAATKAVEVGSADAEYYYGQTLVVVENSKASFYIIQPDNTLSTITGSDGSTSITVNPELFETDDQGNLSLIGFNDAEIGAFFTKGADGTLTWSKPIDAYTKTETDEKIAAAVADAAHLKRKVVETVKDIEDYKDSADAEQYIYMVPTGLEEDSDKYDEYMVISITDEDNVTTRYVEKVGSWEVNLSGYATKTYVDTELDEKVDKVAGSRLMTNDEGTKLAEIETGAQVNIIDDVDQTHFNITDKILYLKDLPVSKITNLQNLLNGKVDAQEGYTLLSPTDQQKLAKLVIGDEGLEISGTVNADNVQGLDEWLTKNANSVVGLSQENFTTTLLNKLNGIEEGAQKNYISSVDSTNFEVTVNGELRLISITSNQVSDLADLLNKKASTASVTALQEDVATLYKIVTWGTIG